MTTLLVFAVTATLADALALLLLIVPGTAHELNPFVLAIGFRLAVVLKIALALYLVWLFWTIRRRRRVLTIVLVAASAVGAIGTLSTVKPA